MLRAASNGEGPLCRCSPPGQSWHVDEEGNNGAAGCAVLLVIFTASLTHGQHSRVSCQTRHRPQIGFWCSQPLPARRTEHVSEALFLSLFAPVRERAYQDGASPSILFYLINFLYFLRGGKEGTVLPSAESQICMCLPFSLPACHPRRPQTNTSSMYLLVLSQTPRYV